MTQAVGMAAFLFRIVLILGVALGTARAETPLVVLSDTAGYCAQLEAMLAGAMANTSSPPEVKLLVDDGHRLCEDGEIRAGIARLRRAIVSLHEAGSSGPPP